MKIINEKGKLFGIINIIDLTVLLVIALLLVGGIQRMKSQPVVVSEDSKAVITYRVSDIRMVYIENMVVGDELYHYDRDGLVGEIIGVDYEPYTQPLESNGEWIDAVVPDKYIATVTVEAKVKDNPDIMLVGGEETRIGSQHRLKNKRVSFFGNVFEIEVLD